MTSSSLSPFSPFSELPEGGREEGERGERREESAWEGVESPPLTTEQPIRRQLDYFQILKHASIIHCASSNQISVSFAHPSEQI